MRHIIYGAGSIGGTIGARLYQHNHEVLLIARGNHLKAIQKNGLVFRTPKETTTLPIPCAGYPSEIKFRENDVVYLTMKTQHTLEALEVLRSSAGSKIPVICAQNGVDNERMAARRFSKVYAMVVMLPASHIKPGQVQAESMNITGILDAGCYPSGTDSLIEKVTEVLSGSGFSAVAEPAVMRLKYTKLLMNLNNALNTLSEPGDTAKDISRMMTREALDCYKAAGIDCASNEEFSTRRGDHIKVAPVEGKQRSGSSSWQSVFRETGSIESDYLNGEIVLLGKLYGIPTPANQVIQQMAVKLAEERGKVGSIPLETLRKRIAEAGGNFS
ncbi:MAG: ketopantoate reductase family protein [Desulfobacteraceae bacterium]|nr:ketopantoate reductase family protein [Desulfobacteraceae bacterium]MBU4001211.1 ketopantoate reductase family protein [Pseudomonadota bacterium]